MGSEGRNSASRWKYLQEFWLDGISKRDSGLLEEALSCFDKVLEEVPEQVVVLYDKCLTLEMFVERGERVEEALQFFDKTLKIFFKLDKVHGVREMVHDYREGDINTVFR